MSFEREAVCPTETYRNHRIDVRYMGPDLICQVDGNDMPNFYLNAEDARAAGRRHIDELHKAAKK